MGSIETKIVTNSIEQKIRQYVADNFFLKEDYLIQDDDSFLQKGVIDSTGVLELITFAQDTFNITIEDSELVPENLDSVRNLAAFIRIKTAYEGSK
jgi:acyl carrier protein